MENNKYNNSCIYKIWKHNFIYIGSTCNFNKRMIEHKSSCNNIKSKSYNLKIYQTIRLNGGWDEFEKEKIKHVCCENRNELREIEGMFIKKIGTINCMIAGRTNKKYREDNKAELAKKNKKYRENNRDKIKQYYEYNKDKAKEYYEDNRAKLTEYKKQYYENNKDKVKQYYKNNKDKISENRKQYYENNKERISEQQKQKIICPICGVFTRKYTIKSHQKTKKCLKFQ